MGTFLDATLSFPAVVLSFPLLVVIAYWLFAAVTGIVGDVLDGGEDTGGGLAGLPAASGLGGVPVTVVLSLVIAVGWLTALTAVVLADAAGLPATADWAVRAAGLVAALVIGWYVTRWLVRPLRRLTGTGAPSRRGDFVGRVCVIRTGRVTSDFGQAEVTADDGGSAVVQVRGEEGNGLAAGSRALIFDNDVEGEFFRVMPLEGALDWHL